MAKFAIENLDINKNRHNFAPLKLFYRGNSSVGRAVASQATGRGFEARFPLKIFLSRPACRCRCCFGNRGEESPGNTEQPPFLTGRWP